MTREALSASFVFLSSLIMFFTLSGDAFLSSN